ncbi:MAG: B12-binding domain-containing radical SAM protein [Magnetococcales bacterium]|nr:B12-binding domain-containing radical SAM protein [Magnetococcales bacterium]
MADIHIVYFDVRTGFYPSFHHGLAYIIGNLKQHGHQVALDHLIAVEDIPRAIERIETRRPHLLGLSFTTNQLRYAQSFLALERKHKPLTIVGGVHGTLVKEGLFQELPRVDAVCIGEGEVPMLELAGRLDRGDDPSTTASMIFRTDRGIVRNPVAPLPLLDDLALPDYTLFDFKKIIREGGESFPMLLGRGCPYKCSYCCNHVLRDAYPNKKDYVRFPSIARSMEIIKGNLALFPETRQILFADDTFTLNKKWIVEFCEVYKKTIGLPYICNARVETINEPVVESLKNSGCASIEFGIESGNEWLRKNLLNRQHSNDKIRKAFAIVKKYGLKTFAFNIVGLPFETNAMARETFRFNQELRADYGRCFFFFPYPGSEIYEVARKYDLLPDHLDQVSGYTESPVLRPVHQSHEETRANNEKLNILFMVRSIASKLGLPLAFENLLLWVAILFRRPIFIVLDPRSSSPVVRRFRGVIRTLFQRHLRVGNVGK